MLCAGKNWKTLLNFMVYNFSLNGGSARRRCCNTFVVATFFRLKVVSWDILTIDPEHVCAQLKAIQSWGIFLPGWKSWKMDNHHLLWQTSEQHDLNTNYYAKEHQEYADNIYGANRYSWNYYSSSHIHHQEHQNQQHHQQDQHMDLPMTSLMDQEQLAPPPQQPHQPSRKR